MRVRLTCLQGGAALRTSVIEGEAEHPPELGRLFWMTGDGLVAGTRVVNTSLVTQVTRKDPDWVWEFITRSGSQYRVERLIEETQN